MEEKKKKNKSEPPWRDERDVEKDRGKRPGFHDMSVAEKANWRMKVKSLRRKRFETSWGVVEYRRPSRDQNVVLSERG